MNCKTCGGPLTGRQTMYCSVSCRNVPLGKKMGGWNRSRVPITCEWCGKMFEVPQYRRKTARACSRYCLGAIQSEERKGVFGIGPANASYIDGRSPLSYRRNLKAACERCGSITNLLIHHRDEDRHNNALENLETLCKRCHQLHHHCARNLPTA